MVILMFGSRGPEVVQLQTLLNDKTSRLPRLVTDGMFGAKTRGRVIEFQRECGLQQDGMAGDWTFAKLAGRGEPPPQEDPSAFMYEIARMLDPALQAQFLSRARPLLPKNEPPRPGPVVGQVLPIFDPRVLLILLVIVLLILILSNSRNPALRDAGRAMEQRFNRLREKLRGQPVDMQEAQTLEEVKEMGGDLAERAAAERDKCLEGLDPKKLQNCAKGELKKLNEVIHSLLEKILKRTGGGIRPENLAKGIAATAMELIAVARAFGQCTGCENMFF